jgi:hypothetical protein
MPQLDFFLFPHIVIQTCIILIVLVIWLSNTKVISLLKSQKTRGLLLQKHKIIPAGISTIAGSDEIFNTSKNMFEVTQLYFLLNTAVLTSNDERIDYYNNLLAVKEKENDQQTIEPISLPNFLAGKKEIYHIYVEDMLSGLGQALAIEVCSKLYPRANFKSNIVLHVENSFAHAEICRAFKLLHPNNPIISMHNASPGNQRSVIQECYNQPAKEIPDPDYGFFLEWEGTKHYWTSIVLLFRHVVFGTSTTISISSKAPANRDDYDNMRQMITLYFARYTAVLTSNDKRIDYYNNLLAVKEKENDQQTIEPISLPNFLAGKKEIYHIYVDDMLSGTGQVFALAGFFRIYPRANFKSNVVLLIKDGFAHTEICRAFKLLHPNSPMINLSESETDIVAIIQKYYNQPVKWIPDPDYERCLEWEGTKHYWTSMGRLYTEYHRWLVKT